MKKQIIFSILLLIGIQLIIFCFDKQGAQKRQTVLTQNMQQVLQSDVAEDAPLLPQEGLARRICPIDSIVKLEALYAKAERDREERALALRAKADQLRLAAVRDQVVPKEVARDTATVLPKPAVMPLQKGALAGKLEPAKTVPEEQKIQALVAAAKQAPVAGTVQDKAESTRVENDARLSLSEQDKILYDLVAFIKENMNKETIVVQAEIPMETVPGVRYASLERQPVAYMAKSSRPKYAIGVGAGVISPLQAATGYATGAYTELSFKYIAREKVHFGIGIAHAPTTLKTPAKALSSNLLAGDLFAQLYLPKVLSFKSFIQVGMGLTRNGILEQNADDGAESTLKSRIKPSLQLGLGMQMDLSKKASLQLGLEYRAMPGQSSAPQLGMQKGFATGKISLVYQFGKSTAKEVPIEHNLLAEKPGFITNTE